MLFIAAAILLCVAFLVHAWSYRFLTDDAFISFRYSRNLAAGYGLVFNPGQERVEGYSNFLWVLLLASFAALGVPPEQIANTLSLACSVALWVLLARYINRHYVRAGVPLWVAIAPLVLLAATRSFAVWSTGGLETRFFELLVVAGVIRALYEVDRARESGHVTWLGSCILLGLTCLTRPDGFVVSLGVLAARSVVEWHYRTIRWRPLVRGVSIFGALVLGHLLFRRVYYEAWVPNTYHAKVGGETWWSMGFTYFSAFGIEYGIVLWIPLIAAAVMGARQSPARVSRLLLLVGGLAPLVIYVLAIGGDHFEYRPFDLIFPFAYLLLADGAVALATSPLRIARIFSVALGALCLAGVVTIPILGHIGFPDEYKPGFPGASPRFDMTQDLVSQDRFRLLFRLPLLKSFLHVYNEQIKNMTAHAVGIRQEEHEQFLPLVREQGRALAKLQASGALPRDAHIAIDAVGALPYYSNLRTLDRLGLTDRIVARSPARRPGERFMAHDRAATIEYAAARRVDLWAPDHTELIYAVDDPRLIDFARKERSLGLPLYAAEVDSSRALIAFLPTTHDSARFPTLIPALEYFQRRSEGENARWWALANLGSLLAERGNIASARSAYERALELQPTGHIEELLAALFVDTGDTTSALVHVQRALALRPDDTALRLSLVRGLAADGQHAEVFRVFEEGLARNPGNISLWIPLARFYIACPEEHLRNPAEALRIAERLRAATSGQDAEVLATLSAAHEALGQPEEARRAAHEAAAVAHAQGNDALATAMERRAESL